MTHPRYNEKTGILFRPDVDTKLKLRVAAALESTSMSALVARICKEWTEANVPRLAEVSTPTLPVVVTK